MASDTQTLLVYEETTLRWAAQLPFNPVYLSRGTFKRSFQGKDLLRDMLVVASATGHVFVSYLGTDPAIFTVPAPITREVNYEETDREFAELQEHIRASQSNGEFFFLN